ncbi:MAG TPA: BlaI/MecI/CopY family transcriptional regulator [Sedimentisphaerales bacterium]|nr:BlaI/MecI/CopY family transcriptional regulator [Sedimentisphaerales bacterium]
MATRDQELTEAEWEIIRVVWERQPCAAPTVQEELVVRKKWTYSTVKTLMDRMVAKGLLTTERIRNLILYRAAIGRQEAQRGELLKTVKRAFGGAFTPMMQFMVENDTLSQRELDELESLIQKKRKNEG